MTDLGGPHGGRRSSGFPESPFRPARTPRPTSPALATRASPPPATSRPATSRRRGPPRPPAAPSTPSRDPREPRVHASGLLDRHPDETGPLVEPEWWSYGTSDHPGHPLTARHSGEEPPSRGDWGSGPGRRRTRPRHPSAPLPPCPRASGTACTPAAARRWTTPRPWRSRSSPPAATPGRRRAGRPGSPGRRSRRTTTPRPTASTRDAWEDQTGGLDVIGAHVAEEAPRRRGRRARREAAEAARRAQHDAADAPGRPRPRARSRARRAGSDGYDADGVVHDEDFGEYVPVKPYDPRTGRARRRRRPVAVLVSLLVLAGLVVGIFVGGQKLLTLIDPASRDFTGQGTGSAGHPGQRGRHPQRHRPDPRRRRRHRLRRPVRAGRRGQRRLRRDPARCLRAAASR